MRKNKKEIERYRGDYQNRKRKTNPKNKCNMNKNMKFYDSDTSTEGKRQATKYLLRSTQCLNN